MSDPLPVTGAETGPERLSKVPPKVGVEVRLEPSQQQLSVLFAVPLGRVDTFGDASGWRGEAGL